MEHSISRQHSADADSDFGMRNMEIGTPSNVYLERKRYTSSFSNCFSHVRSSTAESWLQAFAVWHNATN